MGFQYKPRSAEQWEKRSTGNIYEGYALDSFKVFSAKNENTIRILPPTWENATHYGMDIWVHFGVGPMNATVLCLNKMKNDKCPVCEAWAAAEQEGREDSASLKPTRRVLVWVLDRAPGGDEKQPFLWAMPWTVDRDISKICRDRTTGELFQIDNPFEGYDVYFEKAQKGGGFTEYVGFQLSRRPSPINETHLNYILEHPLSSALNWRTYEEVGRLFMGGGASEEKPTQNQTSAPQAQPAKAAAPVVEAPAHVPPQSNPIPQAFVSSWLDTNCSLCGAQQYTTQMGHTCQSGHDDAPPKVAGNGAAATPPPPQVAAPSASTSKAAAFKQRFSTGGK